jgi:predicted nucleic acid-binding protein
MVTYVLDSSTILRYLDGEAGSGRVAEVIKGHLAGRWDIVISAIHWGEIAGVIYKVRGQAAMDLALSRLLAFSFEIVPVTSERAVRAAFIKVSKKIPYADAFGVELADFPDHILVTADFDLKPAKDVKIEFLPRK